MYFFTETEFNGNTKKLICRKDEEGLLWWLADREQDVGYLAWVAEGNTPEEWSPDGNQ